MPRSSAAPSHAEIARKPEPQRHGWEPAVCGPRCDLLVWPTCRWHSVMGEQPASSQSADTGVGQQAARRSAMSRCSRRQFRRLFGAYGRAKLALSDPTIPCMCLVHNPSSPTKCIMPAGVMSALTDHAGTDNTTVAVHHGEACTKQMGHMAEPYWPSVTPPYHACA